MHQLFPDSNSINQHTICHTVAASTLFGPPSDRDSQRFESTMGKCTSFGRHTALNNMTFTLKCMEQLFSTFLW